MTLPSFPNVDLFSAGVNALYGVLVARNPSHNRGYSVAGLLIMAFFGGIGGGVTRDVLLGDIPGPLKSLEYPVVCALMGVIGLLIYRWADSKEEYFRIRIMQYFKSFSLPWFAILGAQKALEHDLGIVSAIMIGVIATTAGGVLIDLFSGVTPEIVRPAEHIVTAAVVSSLVYVSIATVGATDDRFFPVTLIAVLSGFLFRVFAVRDHWKQIVPYQAPAQGPGARAA